MLAPQAQGELVAAPRRRHLGRHYLSNTTCLIRPHLLCVVVVSRITIICKLFATFKELMR